jgi:Ca-activated chloride channel homolog
MNRTELENAFERLLAEPEAAMHVADSARARAALLSALTRANAAAGAEHGVTAEKLAAYLDGALDADEVEDFSAALLRAPDELHELESAQSFLDAVTEKTSAPPQDLLAGVLADAARETPKSAPAKRRWSTLRRVRNWGLAGAAVSALLAVGFLAEQQYRPMPAIDLASRSHALDQIATAKLAGARLSALRTTPAPQSAAPPTPPANETPEQVLVTGSLIRGTAAVGVPVVNLSPQDFARTGALTTADLSKQDASRYVQNTERYPNATPNPVKITAQEPVSTFSADVDTASYANVRRYLNEGSLPPADAVRVEEMINYFDYHYAVPTDRSAPFQPTVAVYPSPWNKDTQILHIGIKGFDLPKTERPKTNLVFLIDTSGSMNEPNKLPLLQRSFRLLVDQLRPEDRVAIVTYAGAAGTVLEPTSGADKAKILAAIDRMSAGGSTAGGEGIRQAYQLAKANFDKNAVNRVLLATDGDFNVGITDPKALEDFVTRERSSGVFLTVLGFGGGNYNDLTMQKLAQAGNGVAAYIDTINEARKVFVDEIGGTLFTIAKDVKIQVEFNPARVAEYRLIGYETRALQTTDFNNDKVDAGDIGSGHTVTALYEITPTGSGTRLSDPLRYGSTTAATGAANELAFVKLRYKLPDQDESRLITRAVTDADMQSDFDKVQADLRFAAVVAGSAQLLRHDPYIKSFDYDRAIGLARAAKGDDPFGYRGEFIQLLGLAKTAPAMPH